MRLAAIIAALLLSGCASAPTTFLGYRMPAQCLAPGAIEQIRLSVIEVDHLPYSPEHKRNAFGLWIERPGGNAILILRGMPPALRAEVLQHERCHELMWRLTGDGRWHGAA